MQSTSWETLGWIKHKLESTLQGEISITSDMQISICMQCGRPGFDPWIGKIPWRWKWSPGEGNGNLLQYSCWENPMDRGVWRTMVHRVAKSCTWLKQLSSSSSRVSERCSPELEGRTPGHSFIPSYLICYYYMPSPRGTVVQRQQHT